MRTHVFGAASWLIGLFLLPSHSSGANHSGIASIISGPDAVATCALMADRRLACWGNDVAAPTPVDVAGQDVIAASLGWYFDCAIARGGTTYCWTGDVGVANANFYGQLGDGTTDDHYEPRPVTTGSGNFGSAISLAAGEQHVCAVRNDSSIWCWGSNNKGQIGNFNVGVGNKALQPVQVIVNDPMGSPPNPALLGLKSVTAGFEHTCALFTDNSASCWGGGWEGELGNGEFHIDHADSPQTVYIPNDMGTLVPLIFGGGQIAAGEYHTCGLIASSPANSVGCWGRNGHGQLGDGTLAPRSIAVAANDEFGPIKNALALSATYASTCVLLSDATVRCWGSDEQQELGRAAGGNNQLTGITITNTDGFPLGGILQLASGAYHVCALSVDGNIYCWGLNTSNELGPNASGDHSDLPVPVHVDAPIFFDNFEDD